MMHFDDIKTGATSCRRVTKGPLARPHVMRWSAATENWHPLHFDWRYATQHDSLPDVLVNGSWKQHVLIQLADRLGRRDRLGCSDSSCSSAA